MGFSQAIQSGFSKYVKFSGRSSRSEYWWWTLFVFIVTGIAIYLDINYINPVDIADMAEDAQAEVGPATILANLVFFLPCLAIWVRRLHDLDKSGWWTLILVVPLIGLLLTIFWMLKAGTPGDNRFGPSPLDHPGQPGPETVTESAPH